MTKFLYTQKETKANKKINDEKREQYWSLKMNESYTEVFAGPRDNAPVLSFRCKPYL